MIARRLILVCLLAVSSGVAAPASAAAQSAAVDLSARDGWSVTRTAYRYDDLVTRLQDAVKAEKMGLVTVASASDGAANQGFKIRGNTVVGVYRNDFARRMLEASVAAGIEAPIRFYVTENLDGSATLSYKTPGAVSAPYFAEGGDDLRKLATELDTIFKSIASKATGS